MAGGEEHLTPMEVQRWLARLDGTMRSNQSEILSKLDNLPFVYREVYLSDKTAMNDRVKTVETVIADSPPALALSQANLAKTLSMWALGIFATAVITGLMGMVIYAAQHA